MANWASTSYRIEGKREDLQEVYDLYIALEKGKRDTYNGKTDKGWEGNIVWALGGDLDKYYLRGFIEPCELSDDLLSIEAEEAWGASDFRHFLESHYEGMKVYYIVEEGGCEVYATIDAEGRYFSYRYMVNSCINGDDEWEYFNTEQEALQHIANRLELDSITIEQLAVWQENHEDEDDYICFNEYKIVA